MRPNLECLNTIYTGAPFPVSPLAILDGTTDVPVSTTLTWSQGPFADSYNLYLWETGQTAPATPTASNLQTSSWDIPSILDGETTYSWRIDALNEDGTTTGDVWLFTTEDSTPPRVASVSPAPDESLSYQIMEDGGSSVQIQVVFSEAINSSLLTTNNFTVTGRDNGVFGGALTYNSTTNTLTFDPDRGFSPGETISVTLQANFADIAGNTFDGNGNRISEESPVDDYSWSFTLSNTVPGGLFFPIKDKDGNVVIIQLRCNTQIQ